MELAEVKYLGTKPNFRVMLPYPFVSLSQRTGEVTFKATHDTNLVDEESAKQMVEMAPNLFELVPEKVKPSKKDEKGA